MRGDASKSSLNCRLWLRLELLRLKKKRFCQSLYMDFTAHSSHVLPKIYFAIHVCVSYTPKELSSHIFLDGVIDDIILL